MNTIDESWGRYKTAEAYNYDKREEAVSTRTSKEQALSNAQKLIESEEMEKLKAEKKDAKKKRQKEKKKVDKGNNNGNEMKKSTSTASVNSNSNGKNYKTETAEDSEEQNLSDSDKEEHGEDEFIDINAAFVKVSVKQNKNIAPIRTPAPKPEKFSPPLEPQPQPQPTVMQAAKISKPKVDKTNQFTAEALGMQSCYLAIYNNDFFRAIDFLSRAIYLAPEDVRHFLNRSYCYLRVGQFAFALADAQYAKKNAKSMEEFAKAVAREGQALCGLHQYHEAEKCFEEILKLEQGNEWILTELILARASQLTNMGFSKIQALEALKQCSAVIDAVTLLTSGNINNQQLETNGNKSEVQCCDGDEVYFSDDESSSTILLSKLVSTISDEASYFENIRFQPSSSKAQYCSNGSERSLSSNVSTESLPHSNGNKPNGNTQWEYTNNTKVAASTSKPKIQKPIISESSSIWVGSIEKHITDLKLRELFSVFGPINYIRRFDDKHFVFIDFQSKRAATKALNYPNDIKVNGVKLPVNTAQGTTGKK